jgi:predicted nucleic acid-binding protein
MSGESMVLDTNVALYLLRGDRSAADAIVAATALTQQIPLLTADTDFERIKDEVAVLMYEV